MQKNKCPIISTWTDRKKVLAEKNSDDGSSDEDFVPEKKTKKQTPVVVPKKKAKEKRLLNSKTTILFERDNTKSFWTGQPKIKKSLCVLRLFVSVPYQVFFSRLRRHETHLKIVEILSNCLEHLTENGTSI
jgi:hypothetical protein